MDNYYFVAPSLPTLVLGEVPDITFEDLIHRLEVNLSKKDLEKVFVLRLVIDLYNIRALLLHQPMSPNGNLSEKQLEEALLVHAELPEYIFDFLGQFDENSEKVRNFYGLLSRYYAEEIANRSGFLRELLLFQRNMRLVLTALRAKKLHRDIVKELQFEDFTDPLVAQILAQKDMEDYEPPIEFQDLKEKLHACGNDPWEQFKTVTAYEFEKIEEMSGYPLFSIDWILGYLARLMLIEKWAMLDKEKAKDILDKYIRTGTSI